MGVLGRVTTLRAPTLQTLLQGRSLLSRGPQGLGCKEGRKWTGRFNRAIFSGSRRRNIVAATARRAPGGVGHGRLWRNDRGRAIFVFSAALGRRRLPILQVPRRRRRRRFLVYVRIKCSSKHDFEPSPWQLEKSSEDQEKLKVKKHRMRNLGRGLIISKTTFATIAVLAFFCGTASHAGHPLRNYSFRHGRLNKSWTGGAIEGGYGRYGYWDNLRAILDDVLFMKEGDGMELGRGEEDGAAASCKSRKSGGNRKRMRMSERRGNDIASRKEGYKRSTGRSTGSYSNDLSNKSSVEKDREEEESNALTPSSEIQPRWRPRHSKRVLKQKWQRILFFATSIDALNAIFTNRSAKRDRTGQGKGGGIVGSIISPLGIRFFPPRLLFLIGAFARALQMTTPLNNVFNPTLGGEKSFPSPPQLLSPTRPF